MINLEVSQKLAIITVICIIYTSVVSAQDNGNVTEIINLKSFLLNSLYDKDIRPPAYLPPTWEETYSYPTEVRVVFELVNFFGLDEVSGIFETFGIITVDWQDGRIKWDPNGYGGATEILLHESVVWKPKITVGNPSKKFKTFGHDENFVRFTSDGIATWKVGDVIESSCDVDANYFPFDKQECEIWLYPWGYFNTSVTFSYGSVNLDSFSPNGVWNVYETKVAVQNRARISYINLSFKLERKSTYFIVNAFVPVFILGLLNTMVFVLPADSGERVGYSITCLLAIAVLLTIINDNLPKASDPIPIISFFMMLDLGISALMTMITIWNLRLHMSDEKSKVPLFVQRCFGFLRCKNCKSKPRCCFKPQCCVKPTNGSSITIVKETTAPVKEKKNISLDSTKTKLFHSVAIDVMQNTPPSSADSRKDKKQSKKREPEPPKKEPEVEKENTNEITWKDIAGLIDVLSFILGNSLTIILVLLFLSISNTANVI